MGQVPQCRDSTMLTKSRLMFSIDCYNKEIRIVEVSDETHFPRLCLINFNKHNEDHAKFIDLETDADFNALWEALNSFADKQRSEEK